MGYVDFTKSYLRTSVVDFQKSSRETLLLTLETVKPINGVHWYLLKHKWTPNSPVTDPDLQPRRGRLQAENGQLLSQEQSSQPLAQAQNSQLLSQGQSSQLLLQAQNSQRLSQVPSSQSLSQAHIKCYRKCKIANRCRKYRLVDLCYRRSINYCACLNQRASVSVNCQGNRSYTPTQQLPRRANQPKLRIMLVYIPILSRHTL